MRERESSTVERANRDSSVALARFSDDEGSYNSCEARLCNNEIYTRCKNARGDYATACLLRDPPHCESQQDGHDYFLVYYFSGQKKIAEFIALDKTVRLVSECGQWSSQSVNLQHTHTYTSRAKVRSFSQINFMFTTRASLSPHDLFRRCILNR